MRLTLYIVGNIVIIPTVARTQAGYFLEVEPVASLDVTDPALPEILHDLLRRGNPAIPTPSRANFPKPVVLSHAGVKSWSKFTEIARTWQLTECDGGYLLARGHSDTDGAIWGGKLSRPIPLDSTSQLPDTNAIVEAILTDTMNRPAKGR